jgi:hypothetical protein
MNMRNILNIISAVLAAILLTSAASAQGSKSGNTYGTVQFDRTIYDFGDIMLSDGPVTATFTAKNIGSKPVVIYNVVSSCGCTDVEWTRQPLKKNETGTIKATYSNDEGAYPFDKTLTVYISGQKKPVILRLRGESHDKKLSLKEMYPVHFGNLAFKSADIKGGNLSQGEQKSGEVKVANLGSSPLNVTFKDVSRNLSLKLSKNPIPAGETASLSYVITSDRSLWGKNYYYATPVVGGRTFKASGSGGQEKVAGSESIVSEPNPNLGAGHEKIGIFAITKENFSSWTDEEKKKGSQPMFTESTYSFEKVKAGTMVSGAFGLTNKGKSTLKIYKADSESSHLKIEPISDVAAGMSTPVRFSLDTSGLPKGETLLVVNLYTNSPLRPIVNLFVTGWID